MFVFLTPVRAISVSNIQPGGTLDGLFLEAFFSTFSNSSLLEIPLAGIGCEADCCFNHNNPEQESTGSISRSNNNF
jgi:hypothetical protein